MKYILFIYIMAGLIACTGSPVPSFTCISTCAPNPAIRDGRLNDEEDTSYCVCDMTKREKVITEYF